jgi:surfeit locus 1 family protein
VKAKHWAAVLAVGLVAAVCVRLGFWQISRLHEKRAENQHRATALAAPPVPVGAALVGAAERPGLKLEVRGRYDERHQILLSARPHNGSPGVHVVTPLLFEDGPGAVLVDRGFLYAGDAATARPQDYPEPGEQIVTGVAEPLRRGAGGAPLRAIEQDSLTVWSARWLDIDTLKTRLPYAIAPWVVNQLPGAEVPSQPERIAPRPLDEIMHVSYAVQWFLFATILVVGSLIIALRSRREGVRGRPIPGEM